MFAHELIRSDIEIVDFDTGTIFGPDDIYNYTQYLKFEIYRVLQGNTVDKIVYVDTNKFFVVVCSMLATWQLGGSIFLNDVDPKVKSLPYFQNFYKVIDCVIGFNKTAHWVADRSKCVAVDGFLAKCKTSSPKFELPLVKAITQDTVCYYTTSSGTTGDPKLLPFTHYQTVTISNEIKQYLALNVSDRPYHYKTLHHSSLFNSYALPMLNVCKTHYSGQLATKNQTPNQYLTRLCKYIQDYQLTHFLVPYSWIRNFNQLDVVEFPIPLTLITIQGNTDLEMHDLFHRWNIKQVINYFGTSEVGTMFISRTTKDNANTYNPNRFVDCTSYIDYQILDSSVKVKWKHLEEWYIISDKMQKTSDAIWLYGRDLYFKCKGNKIELAALQKTVSEYLNTNNFIVVPDYLREKLYLNVYDQELDHNQLASLNNIIAEKFLPDFQFVDCFRFTPDQLQFGMKINGPLLLYLFRERNP